MRSREVLGRHERAVRDLVCVLRRGQVFGCGRKRLHAVCCQYIQQRRWCYKRERVRGVPGELDVGGRRRQHRAVLVCSGFPADAESRCMPAVLRGDIRRRHKPLCVLRLPCGLVLRRQHRHGQRVLQALRARHLGRGRERVLSGLSRELKLVTGLGGADGLPMQPGSDRCGRADVHALSSGHV